MLNPRYGNAAGTFIVCDLLSGQQASIPATNENTDYASLITAGATIAPFVPPPVGPCCIPRSLVIERLVQANKFDPFMTALRADVLQYERWSAGAYVMDDDATLRSIMTSAGADPNVILAQA